MTEPRLRTATAEDRRAVLALMEETFGSEGFLHDPAFWHWKHEANPFGPSILTVAEAAGEIVALRAFLRWRFHTGRRTVEAVRAVDTATHPAWRGRGLFTRLTRRTVEDVSKQGVSLVFNTPNAKSRPGYLKMGWQRVHRVPVWLRPRRPLALLRVFSGHKAEPSAATVDETAGSPLKALLDEPGLEGLLSTGAALADAYSTPRTPEYLRWRYGAIPSPFVYRALWQPGAVERGGAVIFRLRRRRGLRELDVTEILLPTVDTDAGTRLGTALLRQLSDATAADYLVASAPRGSAGARALGRAGFLPIPWMGPWLTTRPLKSSSEMPDPSRSASWCLSLGDLEIF